MARVTPALLAAAAILAAALALPRPTAAETCLDISWTTLTRSGMQYGSGSWGMLKSSGGKDILEVVSNNTAIPATPLTQFEINPLGLAGLDPNYQLPAVRFESFNGSKPQRCRLQPGHSRWPSAC